VLADRFLRDLKLDALSTLYYVAPPSFVFISMGFAAFELGSFEISRLYGQFSLVLLLNGSMAFALNVSLIRLGMIVHRTHSLDVVFECTASLPSCKPYFRLPGIECPPNSKHERSHAHPSGTFQGCAACVVFGAVLLLATYCPSSGWILHFIVGYECVQRLQKGSGRIHKLAQRQVMFVLPFEKICWIRFCHACWKWFWCLPFLVAE
jgi:hypothetical protein